MRNVALQTWVVFAIFLFIGWRIDSWEGVIIVGLALFTGWCGARKTPPTGIRLVRR